MGSEHRNRCAQLWSLSASLGGLSPRHQHPQAQWHPTAFPRDCGWLQVLLLPSPGLTRGASHPCRGAWAGSVRPSQGRGGRCWPSACGQRAQLPSIVVHVAGGRWTLQGSFHHILILKASAGVLRGADSPSCWGECVAPFHRPPRGEILFAQSRFSLGRRKLSLCCRSPGNGQLGFFQSFTNQVKRTL